MPEFSVIIPARNEAAYLPGTLRALERQTLAPAEVIVVDNASRDQTAQIARSWGAQVLSCPEGGVARARQLGLDTARSSWVATTDADSLPAPGWLAAYAQAALLAGGYPEVEAYEDVILGQNLARLGEIGYVPRALVETSARRLDRGVGPFLIQHLRNLTGHTRGYFGDDRLPPPEH
ncbi:glycosyltransferase [Deinococcus radiodurans]|uniref:glycosyltransferase n=1 Tax=Deinococcus radiodurans TaxID=1299 RepID=UPI0013E8B589|nr:glycosyltransferase [Deinococcus radiodurans]